MTRRTAVPPFRRSAGFTLIELLVALTIAGTAALLAHQIFAAIASGSGQVRSARISLDRSSNVRRFLRSAFLSLEVGNDGAGPFTGRAGEVRFASWLETPEGWFERREVLLAVDQSRLVANVAPGSKLILADSVSSVAFDYLLEPGLDSRWVREWISEVSAPLAVRVRMTRLESAGGTTDTTTYLVKARG
jgi:prepilin-type N-terminal cleavage/methylation domain-containing protein